MLCDHLSAFQQLDTLSITSPNRVAFGCNISMRYAQAHIPKYWPYKNMANISNQNTIIGNPIKFYN